MTDGPTTPAARPPDRDDRRRARRVPCTTERTCRVATVGADGPHATPLWYIWHDVARYGSTRSRAANAGRIFGPTHGSASSSTPAQEYAELRGVEITGRST